jgi:hypothetical protein
MTTSTDYEPAVVLSALAQSFVNVVFDVHHPRFHLLYTELTDAYQHVAKAGDVCPAFATLERQVRWRTLLDEVHQKGSWSDARTALQETLAALMTERNLIAGFVYQGSPLRTLLIEAEAYAHRVSHPVGEHPQKADWAAAVEREAQSWNQALCMERAMNAATTDEQRIAIDSLGTSIIAVVAAARTGEWSKVGAAVVAYREAYKELENRLPLKLEFDGSTQIPPTASAVNGKQVGSDKMFTRMSEHASLKLSMIDGLPGLAARDDMARCISQLERLPRFVADFSAFLFQHKQQFDTASIHAHTPTIQFSGTNSNSAHKVAERILNAMILTLWMIVDSDECHRAVEDDSLVLDVSRIAENWPECRDFLATFKERTPFDASHIQELMGRERIYLNSQSEPIPHTPQDGVRIGSKMYSAAFDVPLEEFADENPSWDSRDYLRVIKAYKRKRGEFFAFEGDTEQTDPFANEDVSDPDKLSLFCRKWHDALCGWRSGPICLNVSKSIVAFIWPAMRRIGGANSEMPAKPTFTIESDLPEDALCAIDRVIAWCNDNRSNTPAAGTSESTLTPKSLNVAPPVRTPFHVTCDALKNQQLHLFKYLHDHLSQWVYYDDLQKQTTIFKVGITDDGVVSGIKRLLQSLNSVNAPFDIDVQKGSKRAMLRSKATEISG